MNGATLSTQITFVIGEDGTTGKVVEIVPAQTPTANEKDYTWEYVYSPKAQSFTVTYVDDTTGEELTDHDFTLSGVTDRSYAKTLASDKWDYAAAGYVLDTDQNATDPLDSLSGTFGATNVNVVVCLKHGTTTQEETGTSTYTVNYTGAANNPTSQPQTPDQHGRYHDRARDGVWRLECDRRQDQFHQHHDPGRDWLRGRQGKLDG